MTQRASSGILALLVVSCVSPPPPSRAPDSAAMEPPKSTAPLPPKQVVGPTALLEEPLCPLEESGEFCDAVRQAERMMGDLDRAPAAREVAERLTRQRPERFEAWVLLGRAQGSTEPPSFGEGGEGMRHALVAFERAHSLAAHQPLVQLELARALLALGEAARAEPLLVELEAGFGEDPEVAGALGVCFLAQGRVRDARTRFERAVKLEKGVAERWVALGAVRMLEGDLDLAEAAFREALHLNSSLARAHGDLGALLLLRGRTAEGIRHLEQALKLQPKNAAYLSNLAYGHYLSGHPGALERARAAVRADGALVSARLMLALILAHDGKLEDASRELDVAAELDPRDPRVATARSDLEGLRTERASAVKGP